MQKPKISVVIPTCDRHSYLCEAIESVIAQTESPFEIIVIDNGRQPIDPVELPVREYLKIVRALPQFGVSQARNLGAIMATGCYIAFLDDDDRWDVGYLQSVRATIEMRCCDIVLGRLRDGTTGEPLTGKQALFLDRDDLIRKILLRNPGAVGSNTVVRREVFMRSAGYDPWITTNEDKALVLDLLLQGAVAERAAAAWVEFRSDGVGPRLTGARRRSEGKARFLRKYWSRMTGYERLYNLVQLARLRLHLRSGAA